MLFRYICIYFAIIFAEVLACDEPAHCEKNKRHCATHEKFRQKCPCTCKPDINFAECCANQPFEHEECRDLCTFDVSVKQQRKFKPMAIKCFNDFFKVQYCLSNAYKPYSDCCLKNGVSQDTPDKPGCLIFCEGKTPPCSRILDYWHCSTGEQYEKAVMCARENFAEGQRWVSNCTDIHKSPDYEGNSCQQQIVQDLIFKRFAS